MATSADVVQRRCTYEACSNGQFATGLCQKHYVRVRRHGDPAIKNKPGASPEVPGYRLQHSRMQEAQGPAKEFTCVDCGGAADHWTYDHLDPEALVDPVLGYVYSLKFEHYDPRCAPCHLVQEYAHGRTTKGLRHKRSRA